jgi:hypothetical protein
MRKLSGQASVQKAEKAMAEAKSDYERRLKVLTHCMLVHSFLTPFLPIFH